jgi:outer membrane protein assembly factor BamB
VGVGGLGACSGATGERNVCESGFRDPNLIAVKLGRTGDLTGTDAIVWQNQRGNSYTAAPVLHEGLYYFITDTGMVSCFDPKTGKPHYAQQRLPRAVSFKASPLLAGTSCIWRARKKTCSC